MNARTFISVSCALVAAASCSGKQNTVADTTASKSRPAGFTLTPEQRQRIHLVAIDTTPFRPVIEATGNVVFNGDKSTQVLSPVSGPATRVVGLPGMTVHRGDPLAYVSSPDLAGAVAAYRNAQTAYRNAKRIADRDSALFKNDALARADLEQAQSDLAAAEADVDAAIENMRALGVDEAQIQAVRDGKTTSIAAIVRSPIDGTVVEKLIADGQLLQAGSTPCFTIADLSTMWVMANVFANDLPNVAIGQPADVITDVAHAPIPGRVDYIAALADPETKAVQVRILAPNNNGVLRRDMFVRTQIKASTERRGILIPTSAVMRDEQNLPFVFVASGNSFVRRQIVLGSRFGDRYQVTSGLARGDQVVAEGALFLQFAESQ